MNNKEGNPDHLTWDEYLMGLAILTSCRSKQPVKKGACIVSNVDRRMLSLGYNSSCGLDEEEFHAATSALIKIRANEESTLYITHYPCNECAKAIVQSKIKKIFYIEMESEEPLLINAGIKCQKFEDSNQITTDLSNWNYENDSDYFMALAVRSKLRSKENYGRNGACLVSPNNEVITLGWSGMPTMNRGDNDKIFSWADKDHYMCHAELNCLVPLTVMSNHQNCVLYTTGELCLMCAKLIVQAGIVKVIYGEDRNSSENSVRKLLKQFKVEYVAYSE